MSMKKEGSRLNRGCSIIETENCKIRWSVRKDFEYCRASMFVINWD